MSVDFKYNNVMSVFNDSYTFPIHTFLLHVLVIVDAETL